MAREVVLVCGPPCAGKSTYVRHHAAADDVVIDADDIAQELGSSREWMHTRYVSRRTQVAWRRRVAELADQPEARAWVIRCAPSAQERRALAEAIRATRVVVLLPEQQVLRERAMQRPSPGDVLCQGA